MNAENGNINNKNLLVDDKSYIRRVHLLPHEVERLTGVDKRKLRYWTQKDYLESKIEDGYRYGLREVRKAALMNRYISGGLSIEAAAGRAEETLSKAEANRKKGETKISREELEALPYKAFMSLECEELREVSRELVKNVIKSPEIKNFLIEELKSKMISDGKDSACS